MVTEVSERRPLQAAVGRRTPISVQYQLTVFGADMQFIVVRVEKFDPVLRPFRERNAMPHLFARTIGPGFALARPSGNLEPGSTRRQPRVVQAVFDLIHPNSGCIDPSGTRTDAVRNSSISLVCGAKRPR